MNRLFDHVHAFIRTNELLDRGESILIGFSGGPDSMFLVEALAAISRTYKYSWDIRLAHLNHGISEREGDNEAFCREMAETRFKLPLEIRKVDVPAIHASGKHKGQGIEALGRRERYRLFSNYCREHNIAKLATGHQLDDQAETVLMRAITGSWLTGLAGIPVRRPLQENLTTEVIRPLLRISRSQISGWVESESVPVFRDPLNEDIQYTRNRVRHKLMPFLKKNFNPRVQHSLSSIGFQAQELEFELQSLAEGFLPEPTERNGQTVIRVNIERLRALGPLAQRYVLRQALREVGLHAREVTHQRIERVRDLLSSERRGLVVRLTDAAGVLLEDDDVLVQYRHTEIEHATLDTSEFIVQRDGTWVADISSGPIARITAEMQTMPDAGLNELLTDKPNVVEFLDAEKVLFPLFVRGRKDGDRVHPLGMDGQKKLQDIFVDAKTPRDQRDEIPLVCDSQGIVAVWGHTIADRARVTTRTSQILMLSFIERRGRFESSGFLPPVR